jgi:Family of unknown function (DUF5334)
MSRLLLVVGFLLVPALASAWDGYDYDSGSYIEIEKGNFVRSGNDIEVYDYGTGEYKDVEVESIQRNGETVEIEVYDSDTEDHRTFEME